MKDSFYSSWEKQLHSGSVASQQLAVRQLEALGSSDADAVLIGTLAHGDEWVVAEAARALGSRRCVAAVAQLVELLKGDGYGVELTELAGAWADSPEPGHAALALAQYSNDTDKVAEAVAEALERIGTQEAVDAAAAWLRRGGS